MDNGVDRDLATTAGSPPLPGAAPAPQDVAGIAALDDEVRRALYLFVCSRPEPVGRDEAAESLGIPHHRAKFHLDRLESSGLLHGDYQRLTGRSGPGAGRPAKVYRRAPGEVAVSLPARDYTVAGELMAQAIARSAASGVPVLEVLTQVALEHGRRSRPDGPGGEDTGRRSVPQDPTALRTTMAALRARGYEPRAEDERILMQNCPFHALARTHPELVCGMNHALLSGLVETCGPDRLRANLDPGTGRCCVTLTLAPDAPQAGAAAS